MKKAIIVIAEEQRLIRELWINLFSSKKEIKIAGEGKTLNEVISVVRNKKPDIVLLEINFSKGSSFNAVERIKKISPRTRIIIVTIFKQHEFAQKMLKLGVEGYITKNSSSKELLKAIEIVISGNKYVCAETKAILSKVQRRNDALDLKNLSRREIEIIKSIKKGLTSKQIAKELDISLKTVEAHRYHIFKKLKLKKLTHLISYINSVEHVLT